MDQQRFRVGQDGYVCAGCGAGMVFDEADGGLVVTHQDGCREVAALRGAGS